VPRLRSREDRTHRGRDRRPEARVILAYELAGSILAIYRRRAEMHQADLAEELNWPPSLISKVERGDVGISLGQLDAIVEVLDDEFLDFGDHPGLTPLDVLRRFYDIADLLTEQGYDVVWATGLAWERQELLVRGRDLQEIVRERWRGR